MKTIAFTYTKGDGSVSNRVLVIANEPQKFVTGTDISELEGVDQAAYVDAVNEARELYIEMLNQINDEFDCNHKFRQFKPELMSNIVEL